MSNSSLLRCAAAFLVLSVYIWLFGITGVIEEETAPVFADQSLEFIPSAREVMDRGGEVISAGDAQVNPVNDPKPKFSDLPAQTVSADNDNSPNSDNSEIGEITEITDNQIDTANSPNMGAYTYPPETTSPVTQPPVTTIPETTAPPETTTPRTSRTTRAATTAAATERYETNITPASPDEASERITVMTPSGQVTDSVLNIVARIVQHEIGSSFDPEAIKAQAVAAYTYVMFSQSQGRMPGVELAHTASERVTENVRQVIGQAVYYDGDYAQTVYCASSADYTASSKNVWSADIPYLRSRHTEFVKEHDPNYGLTTTLTSSEIKIAVLDKTGIRLDGDPANWLEIIDRVDTVYVGAMRIGGQTSYVNNSGDEIRLTGKTFRDIMGLRTIRSAAFEFTYNPTADRFVFTTYGYGHGVGLSQNGANILARHYGYDYRQILEYYYPGTELR